MKIERAIGALVLTVMFLVNAAPAAAGKDDDKIESSKWALLDEIAGALGFRSWRDDGFWEAYQAAIAADAERIERERIAAGEEIVRDAMENGRRVESPPIQLGDSLTGVEFVEYVLPADGDFLGAFARIGTDLIAHGFFGDKITRITRYFADGRLAPVAQVSSVIEDQIETVVSVQQFVPGAVDLQPGDQRKVPAAPGTGRAGQRPQTLDPKSDGSMGRADRGSSSTGGGASSPAGSGDPEGSGHPDPSGADPSGSSGSDGGKPDDSRPEDAPGWTFDGASAWLDSDGTTTSVSKYDNSDGRDMWVTSVTDAHGNTTTDRTCYQDAQEVSCDGLTDEPTCNTASCAQLLAVLSILGASDVTFVEKVGAPPIDFGNPTDAPSSLKDQITGYLGRDPRVTDPANPREEEVAYTSIQREMSGSLRNTGNPLDPRNEALGLPVLPPTGDTVLVARSEDSELIASGNPEQLEGASTPRVGRVAAHSSGEGREGRLARATRDPGAPSRGAHAGGDGEAGRRRAKHHRAARRG